jgi:NLR family CARD domain-containing protein 3
LSETYQDKGEQLAKPKLTFIHLDDGNTLVEVVGAGAQIQGNVRATTIANMIAQSSQFSKVTADKLIIQMEGASEAFLSQIIEKLLEKRNEIDIVEAQIRFQKALRDFYSSDTVKRVPRLFKPKSKSVLIDDCYVNLSIIEQCKTEEEREQLKREEKESSRDARIQTYEALHNVKHTRIVDLKDLYTSESKSEGQSLKRINRLLVRGRAGIGKSTFCRRLAYEWATEHLWQQEQQTRFKWVIWIPLRELSVYASKNEKKKEAVTLGGFLGQYSSLKDKLREMDLRPAGLQKVLDFLKGQTLYLLDGYDEIGGLPKNHSVWQLMVTLENMPQWIVTSRPYNLQALTHAPDRELEVMGFTDENILTYINRYFQGEGEVEKGQQLSIYLKKNRAVWGIAHIPIQLELMCFTWQKDYRGQTLQPTDITMTLLYKKLHDRIVREYLKEGERGHKRYLEEGNKQYNPPITPLPPKLANVLEAICAVALRGLIDQSLLMSKGLIEEAIMGQNIRSQENEKIESLEEMTEVGVLRDTADVMSEDKDYYFLHLTFQEYYAAQHIADALVGKVLWGLTGSKKKEKQASKDHPFESVQTFIQHYKYDSQYEVVWWFVSGLLAQYGQSEVFFDLLDKPPRDAVGIRQAILSIRLLEECITEEGKVGLGEDRYQYLSREVVKYVTAIALNGAQEAGEVFHLAYQALIHSLALSPRLLLTEGLLEGLLDAITKGNPAAIDFCGWLGFAGVLLSTTVVNALVKKLEDEDEDVRRHAAEALGDQENLPKEVVTALVKKLEDKDEDVRSSAACVLGKQRNLPKEAITALVKKLEDEDEDVRNSGVSALGKQRNLPKEVVTALVEKLEHEDEDVRNSAAEALGRQGNLPKEAVTALVKKLEHKEGDVRRYAAEVLGEQRNLPKEVVTALVKKLEDEDEDVRSSVAYVLGKQRNLPKEVVTALVRKLEHKEGYVRSSAAEALGEQRNLPREAVTALLGKLEDKEVYVRGCAVQALGKQGNLPKEVVTALVGKLEDKDEDARSSAVSALGKQGNLPKEVVIALVGKLEDEDKDVRSSAVQALGKHGNLPKEVVTALVGKLEDKEWDVRSSVVSALGQQGHLPKEAVTALVKKLEDKDEYARRRAADVLRLKILPASFLEWACTEENKKNYFTHFLYLYNITPVYIDSKEGLHIEGEDISVFQEALEEFKQQYHLKDTQLAEAIAKAEPSNKPMQDNFDPITKPLTNSILAVNKNLPQTSNPMDHHKETPDPPLRQHIPPSALTTSVAYTNSQMLLGSSQGSSAFKPKEKEKEAEKEQLSSRVKPEINNNTISACLVM